MTNTLDRAGSDNTLAPAGSVADTATTDRLAAMVVDTCFQDLPSSVVAATRRLILDEIAVTVAAYDTPMARSLYKLRGDRGGTPEATLLVDGRRVPATSAAFIHAQLANLLDADETMHNRMHTVSAGVMAALAVAEMRGSTGQELITSIATGYEVTARIGTSLKQFLPDGKGGVRFAPLYGWSWMTLGAAATAGRLLGLDRLSLARALGQAFVTTPVYFNIQRNSARLLTADRPGSWHKYQMSGAMASAGIEAALLVADGWIAQEDILDEPNGFWNSFGSPGCDYEALHEGLGERWHLAEVSIKPYPFCRFGHGTLDLMTDLVKRHNLRAEDIARIDVLIPPHDLSRKLAGFVHPKEPLGLMSSLPTALALVALGVPPGPQWFNRDFSDASLRDVAERVHYQVEDSWGPVLEEQLLRDGFFSRLPSEITVQSTSGESYRAYSDFAMGDPFSPESSWGDDDVAGKARQYMDGILSAAQIERLIEAVLSVDAASDVRAIAKAMAD